MQGEQEDLAPEELAPEELAQEDTAQDAEANLAREEYFREILRGQSPQARRRLRQLNTTEDPRSVLDEEWVQYFAMGSVETPPPPRRCPSRVERLSKVDCWTNFRMGLSGPRLDTAPSPPRATVTTGRHLRYRATSLEFYR